MRFTGGEPLLREDFEELYISARKLGIKVIIFTNATLITPHLAELFAHIPPIDRIEITVYGMTKKSYEAVTRKPGSFEAAWRGINLLLEKKVPFVVKGAVLPPNKDEIEDFEAWAANIPWMEGRPSYSMFFDLRCRRDSEKKNRLIKGLRLSPEEGLEFLTRDPEEYHKDMGNFCSRFIGPQDDELLSCGAGTGSGCVDAYGSFQICMLLRHPGVVYNLRKGNLKDAVTNYFPEIRQRKAKNPVYLARCANCFLKGLCEQCPAKSWMEHGTLDTPVEYFCQIAHIQARYLGLLEEGEMAWEVENWEERVRTLAGSGVGSS
jgi:radical SAM protein with 4Fe4S-binding SPASM domain